MGGYLENGSVESVIWFVFQFAFKIGLILVPITLLFEFVIGPSISKILVTAEGTIIDNSKHVNHDKLFSLK